ncbi:alpha/beta fold hydrolase [Methylogaea oryzae]|uniref:alpha/beta fold hydrolase n=1 Tax=Methylogaea oryzae TaxID=1295382 RepID=UPI0006D2AD98|nr:alpha/beta fold hydrolase [Methylogaea oryzae]
MSLYSETFGQGPDLLLVHGWSMHSGVWGEFAQLLAWDFRVTAVDLPGHGYSPSIADTTLAGWAEAVLAAAPPRAHWLGWSLGAHIALQAAAVHPERVECLQTIGGTPCFVQRPDWPAAMARDVFEAFSREVERDGAAALSRFLGLQAQGGCAR